MRNREYDLYFILFYNYKKMNKYFWRIASVLSIFMYAANLDQARLNMMWQKWSIILPICAFFAAIFRCLYANFDRKNPITRSNSVGILTSLISIITYFIY